MNCKQFESALVDALYHDLDSGQQEVFDAHRAGCPDCAATYQKMSMTLDVMSRREQQDPGEQFWSGYYQRLEKKVEPPVQKVRTVQPWMFRIAAAIVLLLTGFLIGRSYFGQREPGRDLGKITPAQRVPVQTAGYRAQQFLDRSQVLLLGFVNLDPEASAPSSISRRKQLSNDLIRQAGLLKGELKDSQHRRLRELVSELEIILLQIANLEEENDLKEIEMVKGGVDRKGILLKINLEQMRMTDRAQKEDKKTNPHL